MTQGFARYNATSEAAFNMLEAGDISQFLNHCDEDAASIAFYARQHLENRLFPREEGRALVEAYTAAYMDADPILRGLGYIPSIQSSARRAIYIAERDGDGTALAYILIDEAIRQGGWCTAGIQPTADAALKRVDATAGVIRVDPYRVIPSAPEANTRFIWRMSAVVGDNVKFAGQHRIRIFNPASSGKPTRFQPTIWDVAPRDANAYDIEVYSLKSTGLDRLSHHRVYVLV